MKNRSRSLAMMVQISQVARESLSSKRPDESRDDLCSGSTSVGDKVSESFHLGLQERVTSRRSEVPRSHRDRPCIMTYHGA